MRQSLSSQMIDGVFPTKLKKSRLFKMSVKELKLKCLGGTLHVSTFAGQVVITPIVEKIGDTISLDRNQADMLRLYLTEHLK